MNKMKNNILGREIYGNSVYRSHEVRENMARFENAKNFDITHT